MAITKSVITTDFPCSEKPTWATANNGVIATDLNSGIKWQQKTIPHGTNWVEISNNNIYSPSGGVQSVTGLDTDNTDPANPVIQISVDGVTVTGDGTPGNPLVSVSAPGGVASVTDDGNGVVNIDNTDPVNPVATFGGVNTDGITITGDGSSGSPLVATTPALVNSVTDKGSGIVDNTDPVNPVIDYEHFMYLTIGT